jgi:ubiquitin carboxyl-terminal hydrolase 9/24
MLASCLSDNVKNSGQYFSLLFMYAQMGTLQCKQLFSLGCFEGCFQFLTGFSLSEDMAELDKTKQKKWTASQSREFTDLHSLLAYLVLSCDTSHVSSECEGRDSKTEELEMPGCVSRLLFGPLASVFIAESMSACREINSSSLTLIIDMLVKISFGSKTVTVVVIEELMKLYSSANSSELRNLSTIMVEMMSITDSLQSERLRLMIDGPGNSGNDGLLNLAQNCQNSDSCRAYQAVKCLVTASSKSAAVKEKLIQEPAKWQHSVNWLKSKMSESSYWSPSSDSIISNEDSSTRTFQRTTSAQVTLDEANAMLAEFDTDKDNAMDTNNDDNQMLYLDTIDP